MQTVARRCWQSDLTAFPVYRRTGYDDGFRAPVVIQFTANQLVANGVQVRDIVGEKELVPRLNDLLGIEHMKRA